MKHLDTRPLKNTHRTETRRKVLKIDATKSKKAISKAKTQKSYSPISIRATQTNTNTTLAILFS